MKKPKNNSKEAAVTEKSVVENKDAKPTTFVVVRDGYRVSDKVYSSDDDIAALAEYAFWKKVATNHSYGEPVAIVPFDSKKHRVW